MSLVILKPAPPIFNYHLHRFSAPILVGFSTVTQKHFSFLDYFSCYELNTLLCLALGLATNIACTVPNADLPSFCFVLFL